LPTISKCRQSTDGRRAHAIFEKSLLAFLERFYMRGEDSLRKTNTGQEVFSIEENLLLFKKKIEPQGRKKRRSKGRESTIGGRWRKRAEKRTAWTTVCSRV